MEGLQYADVQRRDDNVLYAGEDVANLETGGFLAGGDHAVEWAGRSVEALQWNPLYNLCMTTPAKSANSSALVGAALVGAAIGASAVGFFAIGALAIGSLAIRKGRIDDLKIGKLVVSRLTVENSPAENEC
jgi:hypothetical protein